SGLPPARQMIKSLPQWHRGGDRSEALPQTPGYLTHDDAHGVSVYHGRAVQPGTAMTAHDDGVRGFTGCRTCFLRLSRNARAHHHRNSKTPLTPRTPYKGGEATLAGRE